MSRGGVIAVVGLAAGVAVLVGQALRPDRPSPAGASPTLEAQLDRLVSEIDLRGIPFRQAVETLARQCGANLVLDEQALRQNHFDCSTPVDLRLRNVSLRRALDALTGYAGSGAGVCYTLFGEQIVVTHRDGLGGYAYLRVYDVRDIHVEPRPPVDPAEYKNLCFFQATETYVSPRQETDEELAWMIQDIDPIGWADNGGTVGRVERASGRLVVLTTSETHRQIQSLLDQLRRPPRGE